MDGTALMSAAAMNRTGIALLLISRGADINAQVRLWFYLLAVMRDNYQGINVETAFSHQRVLRRARPSARQ